MKNRRGNKENAFLNGEWATHVRHWGKRLTRHLRRAADRKVIKNELNEE